MKNLEVFGILVKHGISFWYIFSIETKIEGENGEKR